MEFKVHLYLNGKQLDPADYEKIIITSPAIDRIVNEIYEKSLEEE